MPYLSALEVRLRRGAIQIHVYLYLTLSPRDLHPCCHCQLSFTVRGLFVVKHIKQIPFCILYFSNWNVYFIGLICFVFLTTHEAAWQWLTPLPIYGSKRSPTSDCYSGRKRHTTTHRGPDLNVMFPASNFAFCTLTTAAWYII